MQTTNVYETVIKSNDTLFSLFITTTRTTLVYTGKVIICMEFDCISRMEQNKNRKKFVRSFIVFYLKEFIDRTGCSYK